MAQISLPQLCPLCNSPLEEGQPRRVVGFDLSGWPEKVPVDLVGHRACAVGQTQLIQIPPAQGGTHVRA